MTTRTPQRATRLDELETIIHANQHAFIAVAEAFREIKDSRLYRATHSSFDAYCRDRWNLSGSYGYRLSKAGQHIAKLAPTEPSPPSVRQASQPQPPDDDIDFSEPARPTPAPQPPKHTPPTIPTDRFNRPITNPIAAATYAQSGQIDQRLKQLRSIRDDIKKLADQPIGAFIRADQFVAEIESAINVLKFAVPYAACVYCDTGGCQACHDQGWLPRTQYDNAPKELKT